MPPGGALPWYAASSPLAGTAGPSGHCGRPAAPRPDHAWARAAGHGLGALHSLAPVPAHLAGAARCFPDPRTPPPPSPPRPTGLASRGLLPRSGRGLGACVRF